MPCRHAIVAAQRLDKGARIANSDVWLSCYFRKAFQVEFVVIAYAAAINAPLSDDLAADGETLPAPLVPKTAGANRKRRIPSRGEGSSGRVGKKKRPQQCSRCGGDGHNKITCTNLPGN